MSTLSERLDVVEGIMREWERTCKAATPGPWASELRQGIGAQVDTIRTRESDGADWEVGLMHSYPGDAEFACVARTALPATVAYLLEDCARARDCFHWRAEFLEVDEPGAQERAAEYGAQAEALIARLEKAVRP